MCANKRILTDILRNEYGFKGFVVSDMGAIEAVVENHHYLNNTLDTVVATLNAGCNLELANIDQFAYYTQICKYGKTCIKQFPILTFYSIDTHFEASRTDSF